MFYDIDQKVPHEVQVVAERYCKKRDTTQVETIPHCVRWCVHVCVCVCVHVMRTMCVAVYIIHHTGVYIYSADTTRRKT